LDLVPGKFFTQAFKHFPAFGTGVSPVAQSLCRVAQTLHNLPDPKSSLSPTAKTLFEKRVLDSQKLFIHGQPSQFVSNTLPHCNFSLQPVKSKFSPQRAQRSRRKNFIIKTKNISAFSACSAVNNSFFGSGLSGLRAR
jgi:hypothetical protein